MADKQQYPRVQFRTPEGRFVAGDPTKPSDIGHQGKKREIPQTFVALAVNKHQPGVNELLGVIYNAALNGFAQHANIANIIRTHSLPGPYVPEPQRRPFAWKVQDGDWPSNKDKEGYAGCWIFHFATTQPVQLVDQNAQLFPKDRFHLGQYGMIAGSVAINGLVDANCGVYLNPTFVYVLADGPIIVTGPSAAQALEGWMPGQLPAGAVPFGHAAPGAPPAPAPAPQQQQYAPAPSPAYAPPAPVQQQQYAPPAPPPPGMPAPVAGPLAFVDAATHAATWGVQHHPGYRYNPAMNAYDPDPSVPLAPPAPVAAPAVPAGATWQAVPAPTTPAPFPATVSPGNAGYPPVQPHAAFTTG